MALNIWALTIVKAARAEVPAVPLVFLRAATGQHLLRIALSTGALTCSFYAIAPATGTLYGDQLYPTAGPDRAGRAILGERVTPRRWAAVGIGLIGVLVAVRPNGAGPGRRPGSGSARR